MEIVICEEHSSVLPEWRGRGLRGRTLIFLDAHLDLQYVSPERLSALERCPTADAIKRLEKTHHLLPDRVLPDRDSSYGIEDFLHPAHHLGLIDRLIWVAPPHVETGYSRAAFAQLEQMDGVSFEELATARRTGEGWVEITLLGLEITICSYQQLDRLSLPSDILIDIDTDYFVVVPGDGGWIDPRIVFETLSRLPVKPELVTLSRSVGSGFTPLRYRFIADYLAALWENRQADSAHYERLFLLDSRARDGDTETVVRGCRRELESHPDCAATLYLLGLVEPDRQQAERHQCQAAALCSAYLPDLLRSACEFPHRQISVNRATLMALDKELTGAPLSPERQALAQVAVGMIWCSCGQVGRAIGLYRQAAQHLGPHPELGLEIGRVLLGSEQPEQAAPFLEAALQDDKTRAAANVMLGRLYRARGAPGKALEHLETAHQMTPAWGELLSLLADVHQQLGNHQRSLALLDQYRHQRSRTELLARQLGEAPA